MSTTIAKQRLQQLKRLRTLELKKQELAQQQFIAAIENSEYRRNARPQQLPPEGQWFIHMIMAGRGFGKTWTGARWLLEKALQHPNIECAVVAPTFTDARRTCVEGPSGILKALEPGQLSFYNKSNGQITLVNGSKIHMLSAETPERIRGLNISFAWLDELGSWPYDTAWTEGLAPALRIGENPQVVITTTPRPTKLIKEFTNRATNGDTSVVITRGSTFDNAANLSAAALAELRSQYEGTRIGRQELFGELLLDLPGALFTQSMIDDARVQHYNDFTKVVVAVDPAVTSGEDSDETGIVVVGLGADGRFYVIADRSCRDTPMGWSKRVDMAYEDYHASVVIVEKNQGGDFIETTLKQINPYMNVVGITAKVGKRLRAEPVASLMEQGRISFIGVHAALETQMVEWIPDSGESPDRLDAFVHGIASLTTQTSKFDLAFSGSAQACFKCGASNLKTDIACKVCQHKFITPTEHRNSSSSAGFPQFQTR
jgi:phage terminase large subunit-like protein